MAGLYTPRIRHEKSALSWYSPSPRSLRACTLSLRVTVSSVRVFEGAELGALEGAPTGCASRS